MLEVRRLRLLWELRARGTLAAVADALDYSPSAVSQQLALLERETGVQLLRKAGRGVELTAAGHTLADDVDGILAVMERAESTLHSSLGEISGTIRIAAFQTAALALLPQTLRRLHQEHPHLRVEVVQHEPEAAMYETWARGFDLVIAEQYPWHAAPHFEGLDRHPLMTDPIQLALPPRGVAAEFDTANCLESAHDLPWVMEPRGAASRHWAQQACRVAGFEPDIRYETADLQAHLRFIETGNAVALLPGLVHLEEPRVRLVDLPGSPQRTIFTAARAASESHPALAAVRSILAQEVATQRAPR